MRISDDVLNRAREASKLSYIRVVKHSDFGDHMNVGCGACDQFVEAIKARQQAREAACVLLPTLVAEIDRLRDELECLRAKHCGTEW